MSRKIGAARADFTTLSQLWSRANAPVKDKLHFFHALIVSKLQYALSSMWLVTAQCRRLDGFYARCLRKILRIQPPSRISNAAVFSRAGVAPFSEQLLLKQLALLGEAARKPENSPLRRDTFGAGTIDPQIGRFVRRVEVPDRIGRLKKPLSDTTQGAQERWKAELQRLFC